MASQQEEPNPKQILGSASGESEIDMTQVMYVELGRTSGPPQAPTKSAAPKQWQPPKSESTPSNRAKNM